jgi:diguanylate cyclase (GGDEF)-like protein/PAS domain S-box-containing protein
MAERGFDGARSLAPVATSERDTIAVSTPRPLDTPVRETSAVRVAATRRDARYGWLQRSPRLLRYSIVGLTAAIFFADLAHPQVAALSALYAIPILFSLWLERRRYTIALAFACGALAVVDFLLGRKGDDWITASIGAGTAFLTIAIVTSVGLMRLRAERELLYVRKIALTTLRSLGDAVITINNQGRVRFVNRAAERLLAVRRSEAIGRPLDEVFRVDEAKATRAPLLELVERGDAAPVEGLLHVHDGHRKPVEVTRTVIQTRSGEVFGHVLVFRDISARKEHEESMRRMAYRDELTGLPNRTALADRLQLELAHARRNREALALLYIDLDGFKAINDRYEHAVGDSLLMRVAERMRSVLRAGDTIARIGGDEFVVLLPSVTGAADARRVGGKLLDVLRQPMDCLGHQIGVHASVGIALYPKDGEEADTLMRRADKAMYRAKQLGRGRVEVHSGADSGVR